MDNQKENESTKVVKKSGGAKKTPGKPYKSSESKKSPVKAGVPNNQPNANLTGEIKVYDRTTVNNCASDEEIKKEIYKRIKLKRKSVDDIVNEELAFIKDLHKYKKEEERIWVRAVLLILNGDNEEDKNLLKEYIRKFKHDNYQYHLPIVKEHIEIARRILDGNNQKLKDVLNTACRAVESLEKEEKQKEEATDNLSV